MRRFDFTFTEEERVAILTGQKEFPHFAAFSEVLLASGSDEQPGKPLTQLFQAVIEELDDEHPDAWEGSLRRANIDLQNEGRTVLSWLLTGLRKGSEELLPFHVQGELAYGLAFNLDEKTWRLDGYSVITKDEMALFREGGKH